MAIASEKELLKHPEIVRSAVVLVLKDMTALVYRQLRPKWLERQPRNCWNGTLKTRKLVFRVHVTQANPGIYYAIGTSVL